MEIKNSSDQNVSWFCFNDDDIIKTVALGSGDLNSGTSKAYEPPRNTDDKYFVRFTKLGGGTELKGEIVARGGTATYP